MDTQSVWTLSQCGHSFSERGHSVSVDTQSVWTFSQSVWTLIHCILSYQCLQQVTHCLTRACRKLQSYTLSYQGPQNTAQSYTRSYQGLQKTALRLTRACSWIWSLHQWCCVRWGWSGRNFRKDWTFLPKGDDQNLDQPHQV